MSSSSSSSSSTTPPCTGDCCFWVRVSKRQTQDVVGLGANTTGQYLKVEVTGQGGLVDDGIFVFQRQVMNPETGEIGDLFTAIAGPLDMEELPYGPLPAEDERTLWRGPTLEVYERSKAAVDQLWADIQSDLRFLLRGLKQKCNNLDDPTTHEFSESNG
jgi:hypothetical protein